MSILFTCLEFRAKLSTLNVRGLGNDANQKVIFEFASTSRSDFVFLQETLAARPDMIDSLRSKWPGKSFWSPALGKQGGVAILVSPKTDFDVLQWKKDTSGRVLSVLARAGDINYNFVNIYAPTNPSERKRFFDTIPDYFFPNSVRILAGDFNCVENAADKFGGNFVSANELKDLRRSARVVDIWRKTHGNSVQCTWFNADKSIGSRLDKFFIAQDLVSSVIRCDIFPCVFSDHDSVDLIFEVENVSSHGPGVWRLNLALLQDTEFCEMISRIISNFVEYQRCFPSLHDWWDFLKTSFKDIAQDFGKRKQKKLNHDKVIATNLLIQAKRDLLAGDDSAKIRIEYWESSLQALNSARSEAAKIRSRAQWLEEGEKSTKYFFALESSRRDKNSIRVIYNSDGGEVVTQQEIEKAHCDFYRKLYSCEPVDPRIQRDFLSKVEVSLKDQEINDCECALSAEEISRAVRGLSQGKTPGSDGLPLEFYVKFWDQLCPILLQLYNFSFDQGFLSSSMQESVTRLIFKKDDPKHLKNWRPISLLNVDYKILSKALTNRLSKVLPSIVSEDQTCSVSGRTIFDNLTLFRDTLDYINLTGEPGILVSLDQEKAFDRVDRSFLSNVLRKFGFGSSFLRWISILYHDATMRIIVNGFLTDHIPLQRGVRQGDPLSPLLYILCAEVLACNIRAESKIQGFLLPGARGQQFKMRQYADDSTCFVKDLYSLSVLFSILRRYELGTGAKLNYSKTEAMWLGAWRSCPDRPLGLEWVTKMKILGVWYTNGLANVEHDNWQSKLNKLEKNLNLWKTRSLSFVGKALIINVFGASKFWFLARVLSTPEWVISRFKTLVFSFLWGSKIETVGRQTLSAPVKDGGLGIIDFLAKSKALKISLVVSLLAKSESKAFYLTKYFIGSQLARLRPEWSLLRDNSSPSALKPTAYYEFCLKTITALEHRLSSRDTFTYSAKNCYVQLLRETVSAPLLPVYWRALIGSDFSIRRHWSLVRDQLTENFKNDLVWLITLRGIKVRDSLRSWGYIATDRCAYCQRKETIDHCFLNCTRAKRVWLFFSPLLSALLNAPFVANVKSVFFCTWGQTGPLSNLRALYIIKTILYGIWTFRNKATFHNGTETPRAIVRYIKQDITTRLKVDFSRFSVDRFSKLWCHPNLCEINRGKLVYFF